MGSSSLCSLEFNLPLVRPMGRARLPPLRDSLLAFGLEFAHQVGAEDELLTRSVLALPGLAPADVIGNSVFTESVRAILPRIRSEGLRPVMRTELTA